MTPAPVPFFLDVDAGTLGQRFAIYHAPQAVLAKGLVVYVHPFAEEMNKSRRMAAMQSRAMAHAGYAVLQMDLLGCGDSAGDFGDATWARWVDDVVFACQWLRRRESGADAPTRAEPPLWLWTLRCGSLLAAEAALRVDIPCAFLFWQPVTAGKTILRQFLRLKVAGGLLDGQANGSTDHLRAELAAGRSIEVAGYWLRPELCLPLERSTLRMPPHAHRAEWVEISAHAAATFSPVVTAAAVHWAEAGCSVRTQVVQGPSFWQTTEIEDAPELLQATAAALHDAPRPQLRATALHAVAEIRA